jgi:hypothetical protein
MPQACYKSSSFCGLSHTHFPSEIRQSLPVALAKFPAQTAVVADAAGRGLQVLAAVPAGRNLYFGYMHSRSPGEAP